jgi:iron complex outermembrane receptor protein
MRQMNSIRAALLVGCSIVAVASGQAVAQTTDEGEAVEEVVVTGSRIIRDGFQAPTPLTVLDSESLNQHTATPNLADTLRLLPIVTGGTAPRFSAGTPSSGNAGINAIGLRSQPAYRSLVLIDGHRVVQTLPDGTIDVNTFPQQLIQRVEIVSGGASAVYGSDAVSGVVNFILDRKFTGLKGELSGGITDAGKNGNGKFNFALGAPFAGGRGHVLFSGEAVYKHGVYRQVGGWNNGGAGIMQNPAYTATNGQPEQLLRRDIGLANATAGGLIISGPLMGTSFGPGGSVYQLNYGPLVAGGLMAGGDWRTQQFRHTFSGDPREKRGGLFFRGSYDLTENVNVFTEASWNYSEYFQLVSSQYDPGNGPTILSGNPFIPAEVQARMTALNLSSIRLGSMNYGMPDQTTDVFRVNKRLLVGAEGSFDAFGTDWSWDAYAQYSVNRSKLRVNDVLNTRRFAKSIDAVRDPATGNIACRVTLQTGEYCQPWNYLGIGVNEPGGAAEQYLFGDPSVIQKPSQYVAAASISGAPFSNWAGPVSVAFSAEWRKEKAVNTPSPDAAVNQYRAANFQPFNGETSVIEAAAETLVPLMAEDSALGAWDVSLAARATEYKHSGYVTTWKVGTTWAPIPDIRVRATRSRDIRAPTLQDMFGFNLPGFDSVRDPFTSTVPLFQTRVAGNPDLMPEIADTYSIGVVLQPSFIRNFNLSVDYWKIDIRGGIGNLGYQNTVDLCFRGQQQFCELIERTNGVITRMTNSPQNFASQKVAGLDVEATYRFDVADIFRDTPGEMAVRANLNRNLRNETNPGIGVLTDSAGQNSVGGTPSWRLNVGVDYTLNNLTVGLMARAVSDGVWNTTWIECDTGCPTSTPQNRTINVGGNRIDGAVYYDGSVNYRFQVGETDLDAFLNVRNLLGSKPVIVASQGGFQWARLLTNDSLYEPWGRIIRVGVRFRM